MNWYEPKDATTPRGWLNLDVTEHPDYNASDARRNQYLVEFCLCVGNFLQYDRARGPNGESVHAVRYSIRAYTTGSSSIPRGAQWFHTANEAKAWIAAGVDSHGAQLAFA